ncbi:MAG TPA: ribonuclease HII [Methanotrichaceae archaeon]|nr:ribonuclease HII [Methanotrichaceae archaeon]
MKYWHEALASDMRTLGVDEAGKGPVLGSMFVAGVVFSEDRIFDLAAMGVKDSKLVPAARREALERRILDIAEENYVLEVTPRMIDELRSVMTMNEIMVRCHSKVVSQLTAERAILDAADVDASRFALRVEARLTRPISVIAEHQADRRYLEVGAASILAKVRRDRSMRDLEKEFGCTMGSGYPADPDTICFLQSWLSETGDLPPCARRSWKTAQRLRASLM